MFAVFLTQSLYASIYIYLSLSGWWRRPHNQHLAQWKSQRAKKRENRTKPHANECARTMRAPYYSPHICTRCVRERILIFRLDFCAIFMRNKPWCIVHVVHMMCIYIGCIENCNFFCSPRLPHTYRYLYTREHFILHLVRSWFVQLLANWQIYPYYS